MPARATAASPPGCCNDYQLGWLFASFGAAPLLASCGWRGACLKAFFVVPLLLPLAWLLRR